MDRPVVQCTWVAHAFNLGPLYAVGTTAKPRNLAYCLKMSTVFQYDPLSGVEQRHVPFVEQP